MLKLIFLLYFPFIQIEDNYFYLKNTPKEVVEGVLPDDYPSNRYAEQASYLKIITFPLAPDIDQFFLNLYGISPKYQKIGSFIKITPEEGIIDIKWFYLGEKVIYGLKYDHY